MARGWRRCHAKRGPSSCAGLAPVGSAQGGPRPKEGGATETAISGDGDLGTAACAAETAPPLGRPGHGAEEGVVPHHLAAMHPLRAVRAERLEQVEAQPLQLLRRVREGVRTLLCLGDQLDQLPVSTNPGPVVDASLNP